jgi:SGNH hydrolase-like domain, acetyltransferase AlgX
MREKKTNRQTWQLRIVIPSFMAAVFLLDAGMRFMPIDPFTFRAWEALERNRPPGAAFEPNRLYYNARSYGDLAAMGNFPNLRQYRPERFTTDALGFRNPPGLWKSPVDAILTGDSFAVGSGVRDDQTLSAQLSTLTGCGVYNAGIDQHRITPGEILALAGRLHLRSRHVIRLYTEGAEIPLRPTRRGMLVSALVAHTPFHIRNVIGRLRGLLAVSPLQSLGRRAWKVVANGRFLPNAYASNVVRASLSNGETMLFRAEQVRHFYSRRGLTLDYWRWLRDDLQAGHLDLLVVVVPDKYRVYRSFLINQTPDNPEADDYLNRLDRALQAMGIPVLDLTPVLSAEAARYLEHGKYLYWSDDIHWNARGIAVAAQAIRNVRPLATTLCHLIATPRAAAP